MPLVLNHTLNDCWRTRLPFFKTYQALFPPPQFLGSLAQLSCQTKSGRSCCIDSPSSEYPALPAGVSGFASTPWGVLKGNQMDANHFGYPYFETHPNKPGPVVTIFSLRAAQASVQLELAQAMEAESQNWLRAIST